jgi:hypothetical protein
MDFITLSGIFIAVSTIITSTSLGIRWLVKHYFDEIKAELKPNSGSSLKDQVSRLEKEMLKAQQEREKTNAKIDHMYDLFVDYVSSGKSPKPRNSKK